MKASTPRTAIALALWLVGFGFAIAYLVEALRSGDGLLAALAVVFGLGFGAKAVQSAAQLLSN